jgi:hypothetical protein
MKYLAIAVLLLAYPALAQPGQPGQHFVENWDLDGDGQVTVAEAEERRGDVFLSFDSDDDGFLDAEEYVYFDEARANDMANEGGQGGHALGAMKNAADGMELAVNDLDKDGKVSREEFLAQASVWIAAMDSTGDGVVTTADFGRGPGQGQGLRKGLTGN